MPLSNIWPFGDPIRWRPLGHSLVKKLHVHGVESRPNWSRALPQPLVIPKIMTLGRYVAMEASWNSSTHGDTRADHTWWHCVLIGGI